MKTEFQLAPISCKETLPIFFLSSPGLVIVFTKTCKSSQLLSMTLTKSGFPAEALHSERKQRERMAALSTFRSCQVKILIATDVASRGLDIPEVQLVINHNVPSVTKDYIHR